MLQTFNTQKGRSDRLWKLQNNCSYATSQRDSDYDAIRMIKGYIGRMFQ